MSTLRVINLLHHVAVCIFVCAVASGCGRGGPPIPKGDIDEVMKDQTSFYSMRGGSDYDRLPLRYPFHLVDIIRRADLCEGRDILVQNVTAVNMSSNIIYGSFGPSVSFGETNDGGWFLVNATNNLRTGNERAIRAELESSGISNPTVISADVLIKRFMYHGTLPFGSNGVAAPLSDK